MERAQSVAHSTDRTIVGFSAGWLPARSLTAITRRRSLGARLVAAHGHWRTATFIAGLRQTGIVAPLVLDGPMTDAPPTAEAAAGPCSASEQFLISVVRSPIEPAHRSFTTD